MNKTTKSKHNKEQKYNYMRYVSLSSQLLVFIGVGVYAGLWLDERFSTSPLFLVILPVLGIFLPLFKLVRDLSK